MPVSRAAKPLWDSMVAVGRLRRWVARAGVTSRGGGRRRATRIMGDAGGARTTLRNVTQSRPLSVVATKSDASWKQWLPVYLRSQVGVARTVGGAKGST